MPTRLSPPVVAVLATSILLGTWILLGLERTGPSPAAAVPSVGTPESMLADVRTLADPAMKGRAEANGGAAIAADFIERRFRSLGLRVERQAFGIPTRRLLDKTSLDVGAGPVAPGADFVPLTYSGQGVAEGRLVPGLAARISGDSASLAGAIAVERVPAAPGVYRTLSPTLAERALRYQDLGAAAVLFVADSRDPAAGGEAAWAARLDERTEARIAAEPAEVRAWLRDRAGTGTQSRVPPPPRPLGIPAALVSWDLGRRFNESRASFARLTVAWREDSVPGTNVLAVLPGSHPGRSAVIVSAHFDSHGVHPDGRVFPGACDNASGVAVLLAVAESLARSPRPLPRPVVFAAFGGEELGLHGSRAFALAADGLRGGVRCDFNVDMAARGPEDELYLVGSAFAPDVAEVAKRAMEDAGFAVKTSIDFTFRFGSDHWSLHRAGIPSVLFTCGRSPRTFPECDTPDDAVEACSPAKMRRVAVAVVAAVVEAARRDKPFDAPLDAVVKFPGEK